jgi:hypothetical protein
MPSQPRPSDRWTGQFYNSAPVLELPNRPAVWPLQEPPSGQTTSGLWSPSHDPVFLLPVLEARGRGGRPPVASSPQRCPIQKAPDLSIVRLGSELRFIRFRCSDGIPLGSDPIPRCRGGCLVPMDSYRPYGLPPHSGIPTELLRAPSCLWALLGQDLWLCRPHPMRHMPSSFRVRLVTSPPLLYPRLGNLPRLSWPCLRQPLWLPASRLSL